MTIKNFSIVLLLIAVVGLGLQSCKKKPRGCTDPDAVNFDVDAEVDDGTCLYQRTFWSAEDDSLARWIDVWVATADSTGAPMEKEGRINIFYPNSVPACRNADGTVEVLRGEGVYQFELENDRGNIHKGSVKFRTDNCRLQEVNY